MKPLFRSFSMFLRQISKDSMLYAVLAAPLFVGGIFRFGVPAVESALCGYYGEASILTGYYVLFDLFLAVMTPYFISFVSAMVMLAEYDENMSVYMAVTPVGKRGYIISRLVFPAIISILVSAVIMFFFSLTTWNLPNLLITCLLSSLLSIVLALLIVAFSHNRVEGMALAKISGVFLFGLFVPFFLSSGVQYLFSPLPSFWIAKLCIDGNYLLAIPPAILTSFLWIWALYGRFIKKLS